MIYKLYRKCKTPVIHPNAYCSKLAVEVHRIKYIQTEEGCPLRLDYDNLEALCTDCHNNRY